MASKQLGKLRQWAGEVISSRDKTQTSTEFQAMEQDMEIRRRGVEKLHIASRDYLEYISQQKQSDAAPGEDPMMATEALGVVMIGHGEDLGDGSALGRSLAIFGRARCRVAAMQNIYAVTFTDTFLAYLERSKAELDDYAAQRKKLESRRLAYDAAIAKADKSFKKEKDKKEAEEELAKAKLRYEEMSEDVRARMDVIREDEVEHQRELKNLVQVEMKFIEQYLEVLKEVKSEWPEPDTYADLRKPTSLVAPHNFSRTSTRSTDSKEYDMKKAPPVPSRFGSHRSTRSVRSTGSKKSSSARSARQHESSSESDNDTPHSRPMSRVSRRMSTKSSRPPSRVSTTHSHSGSVATLGTPTADTEMEDDTNSVKSGGKHKKASSGVASWVGDAMSSVMSRNKSRNMDVDHFSTLGDEDEVNQDQDNTRQKPMRRLSNHSTKSNKSAGGKRRSPPSTGLDSGKGRKKVMKALYDFTGSSDELSFKAGEQIVVVSEVLDDWWLGEVGGRKGLFPTNYATLIKTTETTTLSKSKNASSTSILGLGQLSLGSNKVSPEEKESRRTLVDPSESELSMSEDETDADINDWHPFDDRHRSSGPSSYNATPVVEQTTEITSVPHRNGAASSGNEDFKRRLSSSLAKLDVHQDPTQAIAVMRSTADASTSSPSSSSPVKRIPPPPPPRRQSTAGITSGPPPLPSRNHTPNRTHSSNFPLHSLVPPALDRRAHSESNSPFESQSDLSYETVATTFASSSLDCAACGCNDFVEDPFRGHGLCANCTHSHN